MQTLARTHCLKITLVKKTNKTQTNPNVQTEPSLKNNERELPKTVDPVC